MGVTDKVSQVSPSPPFEMFENDRRPAWLNWVFLGMFLWSSWQLFGFWSQRLSG